MFVRWILTFGNIVTVALCSSTPCWFLLPWLSNDHESCLASLLFPSTGLDGRKTAVDLIELSHKWLILSVFLLKSFQGLLWKLQGNLVHCDFEAVNLKTAN
jgi:hypothetical protein